MVLALNNSTVNSGREITCIRITTRIKVIFTCELYLIDYFKTVYHMGT